MFRQILDKAEAGDQMGALIKGIKRNEVKRGQVLAKRDTIKMINNFDAKVLLNYLLKFALCIDKYVVIKQNLNI